MGFALRERDALSILNSNQSRCFQPASSKACITELSSGCKLQIGCIGGPTNSISLQKSFAGLRPDMNSRDKMDFLMFKVLL